MYRLLTEDCFRQNINVENAEGHLKSNKLRDIPIKMFEFIC